MVIKCNKIVISLRYDLRQVDGVRRLNDSCSGIGDSSKNTSSPNYKCWVRVPVATGCSTRIDFDFINTMTVMACHYYYYYYYYYYAVSKNKAKFHLGYGIKK